MDFHACVAVPWERTCINKRDGSAGRPKPQKKIRRETKRRAKIQMCLELEKASSHYSPSNVHERETRPCFWSIPSIAWWFSTSKAINVFCRPRSNRWVFIIGFLVYFLGHYWSKEISLKSHCRQRISFGRCFFAVEWICWGCTPRQCFGESASGRGAPQNPTHSLGLSPSGFDWSLLGEFTCPLFPLLSF